MRPTAAIAIHGERKRKPTQRGRRLASPSEPYPRNLFLSCPHPTCIGNYILPASVYTQVPVFDCCRNEFLGRSFMRTIPIVLLLSALVLAQASPADRPTSSPNSSPAVTSA